VSQLTATVVLACAGTLVLMARAASAQEGIFTGMQKGVEFRASTISSTTTFANGLVSKTTSRSLFPTITFNIDTLLYPSLRLNTGGVFERDSFATNINGNLVDSTFSRSRPFILLRSTSPVFAPGVGYFRREERAGTAGLPTMKLVNDEYAGYLGWYPAGGPRTDLQYLNTHTFDEARTSQDVGKNFVNLISSYTRSSFMATYLGTYLDSNDHVVSLETTQQSHAARATGSGSLLTKRWTWNGLYNLNYQNVRSVSTGTSGEVALPITPFAGLAALGDLPTAVRLTANPLLVDANLTAGAGIDIGLTTATGDQQARNIGLDLLNPTPVNRMLVWVDRELPIDIASAFSWEIYSSSDDIVWKQETVVPIAPFGPFENRFQIDFPSVTARYVKVVTKPLSVAAPDAARFPDILVTELQAFVRQSAAGLTTEFSQTTHIVNADTRFRLMNAPSLFYEGYVLYDGPASSAKSTATLSNGLTVNHSFARIFSAYARAAREQGHDTRGERTATVSNATLTIDPMPTLRSSLLYTGEDEQIDGLPSTRRGIFIQNSAQPYRGVNVLFGIGWNSATRETGEISHDRLMNATATVTPRQHVTFTFSYDELIDSRSGVYQGPPQTATRRAYAAVAFDPMRTLHLVLGEEAVDITGQNLRSTHNINVNWAPFPDGTLQLMFAHNEELRALEFGSDTSTIGAVRWNLSRRSYLDVSYQKTRSEFTFQTTASSIFAINIRLFV
jgi:hypothetical protein